MHLQNNYDLESCKEACRLALRALEADLTVRQVEAYLRHGRNHNEW